MIMNLELTDAQKANFWRDVEVNGADQCWPWMGPRKETGYGRCHVQNKTLHAHRLAFIITSGSLTEERPFVLHSCDNPPCCNPAHLRAGTQKENAADRRQRGRHSSITSPATIPRGLKHWNSKLSDEDVAEIKSMSARGEMQKTIAARFHLSDSYVSQLLSNKKRKHAVCS